ncbi:protein kinase domain-containing protein, partial [Actinokineospora bangkokensis]|uniref:protein kinase domain-containing protein n=1 Tax=Actinokineospora bangkokensis TaxID=1193682 RepID=UPI0013017BD9
MATVAADRLHRLGDGPVATVYSGQREGAAVAYKVYPRRFDKRTLSAFTKEQATLAGLREVTSLLVVDAVDELPTGEPALRMELCASSLALVVGGRGPMPAGDVVALGKAVATALSAAHDSGVVHGGMSPHNILFRAGGDAVLSDFGLPLRHATARDPLHALEFLPPETLRTGTLDVATDLYGLGALLHYALAGRTPHPGRLGEQPGERVLRILSEPVPALNAQDLPVSLATLVARLLAADPAHRPARASLVVDQLTALLPDTTTTPSESFDDFALPRPTTAPPPHP